MKRVVRKKPVCIYCYQRKLKCTGFPCTRCQQKNITCYERSSHTITIAKIEKKVTMTPTKKKQIKTIFKFDPLYEDMDGIFHFFSNVVEKVNFPIIPTRTRYP